MALALPSTPHSFWSDPANPVSILRQVDSLVAHAGANTDCQVILPKSSAQSRLHSLSDLSLKSPSPFPLKDPGYPAVQPPSIKRLVPVIVAAASLARKTTAPMISSTSPRRPA